MSFPTNPLDIMQVYNAKGYTLVTAPSDSDPIHTLNWFIIGDGVEYHGENNLFIGNSQEVSGRNWASMSFSSFGFPGNDDSCSPFLPTSIINRDSVPHLMVRAAEYYHEWYEYYRSLVKHPGITL